MYVELTERLTASLEESLSAAVADGSQGYGRQRVDALRTCRSHDLNALLSAHQTCHPYGVRRRITRWADARIQKK